MAAASSQPENPFAAPQAEEAAQPQPLSELHGRMPGSVMLAIGSLVSFLALAALLLVVLVVTSGAMSAFGLLTGCVLAAGTAITVGLWRRSRFCRACARAMGIGLGGLLGLLVGLMIFSMVGVFNSDEFRDQMQQSGTPYESWGMMVGVVIAMAIYLIPVVLLLAVFFALGTTTARQYFYLLCPQCRGKRVTAVNRSLNHLRCSGCGHEWQTSSASQPSVTAR